MQDKSTWWSITVFGDEIALVEDEKLWPSFVEKVFGGREECPDTKRVHFQGAVKCRQQQRFSAIKKWLPTTHIEVARSSEALKKYAMKEDTAVGLKEERSNPRVYLTMAQALLKVASVVYVNMELFNIRQYNAMDQKDYDAKKFYEAEYWLAVNKILRSSDIEDIGLYTNPQFLRAWIHCHETFRLKYLEQQRAIVLQASAIEDDPELKEGEDGALESEINFPDTSI